MSIRDDLIYLPALLMDMSTGSITLGVTFFASRLGASSLAIGAMASVTTLLYVLFCQVFGRLSDRVNRKRVPQLACLSLSVLYLVMPFCRNLTQLVGFYPVTGIALAAVWPALEAWIGERGDGRPLMKRVRMFNLFWTAGLMIGYVSGGYIHDLYAFAPFYFSSAAALFATAAITVQPGSIRKEIGERQKNGGSTEDISNILAKPEVREDQVHAEPSKGDIVTYLRLGWMANFVSYFTLGILRYILPRFIYELGLAPRVFGRLMMCQAGAQFLMFFVLGATEKWHYRFAPLVISQTFASLGFLSIWLINSPGLWTLGLVIIGINVGMTYFSSIYYSLCGNVDLGSKSGWHESILHSGSLMSTLIGGALASYAGFKSPYLFCAAVILAGLPVQSLILRRNRK